MTRICVTHHSCDCRNARLATLGADLSAAVAVLHRIYPSVASRVIQLEQAGEDRAMAAWNEDARMIHAVLSRPTVAALTEDPQDD